MSLFTTNEAGFVFYQATSKTEDYAQQLQRIRDQKYREGSPYQPEATDRPWVGFMAELVVHWWLRSNEVNHKWITDDPLHQPDFIINKQSIDVKTSKRKIAPRDKYTCGMSTRQIYRPVDYYFWCWYEYPLMRLWMIGAMKKADFVKLSVALPAGSVVHPDYIVRAGNEISNIEINRLTKPYVWLDAVEKET